APRTVADYIALGQRVEQDGRDSLTDAERERFDAMKKKAHPILASPAMRKWRKDAAAHQANPKVQEGWRIYASLPKAEQKRLDRLRPLDVFYLYKQRSRLAPPRARVTGRVAGRV